MRPICYLIGLMLIFGGRSWAVELELTAEQRYQQIMKNPNIQADGQVTGEEFCWHAAYGANDFVTGYRATGDTAWLDYGVRYFDWLVSLMATAPDGYKGWIGPFIYDKSVWCDVHVGDAILINPMLDFAEMVVRDDDLRTRYGDAARRYVDLAQKHLIEKWDARGTWYEDGPYGAYASWNQYLEPGDLSAWREMPIAKSTLSLPFNKQFDMGIACLRLWRMTGEALYADKAERIFRLMKSRIRLVDDHYVWNYWEPAGEWDIEGDELRHWVNVHPYRNYQAGEVQNIVEAYHSGIVFDRTDIERIIRTNLDVMWNGDMDDPKWRNSNAMGPWEGPPPLPENSRWKGRAGTLWSGLKDFDATIRSLYEKSLKPGTLAHAFYENVTKQEPVGFDRKYVAEKDARVFDVAYSNGGDLTMVAALPSLVMKGWVTHLVCQTAVEGPLQIAVYRGAEEMGTLYDSGIEGAVKGVLIVRWDGAVNGQKLESGAYTIRWVRGEAYRAFPVEVE